MVPFRVGASYCPSLTAAATTSVAAAVAAAVVAAVVAAPIAVPETSVGVLTTVMMSEPTVMMMPVVMKRAGWKIPT